MKSSQSFKTGLIFITIFIYFPVFSDQPEQDVVMAQLNEIKKEVSGIKILSEEAQARFLSPLIINADYSESASLKMDKARFYFDRKDYISSGSIYYSIVMSDQENSETREEALFYLAESLYNNRNYISPR